MSGRNEHKPQAMPRSGSAQVASPAMVRAAQNSDLSAVETLLTANKLPLDGVAAALECFVVAEHNGALVTRAIRDAESRGAQALYLLTTTAEHYFPSFGFKPITRDLVPADVQANVEFVSACPASAVVMRRERAS